MKRLIIFLLPLLALASCERAMDTNKLGGVLSEDQILLTVENTSPGSNEIRLVNNTVGAAGRWSYIIDGSNAQSLVVRLPFVGEIPIQFTATCDGGLVTVTRTVTISQIDKPVDPVFTMLAGSTTAGKTWTWDDSQAAVYGPGGYGNDQSPTWGGTGVGAEFNGYTIAATDEFTFDLNGGPNITVTDGKGTQKGTFRFDMSKPIQAGPNHDDTDDSGAPVWWSVGTLYLTGATVPAGGASYGGLYPVTTFDILKLTDDTLVLAYTDPGSGWAAWATCTFWMFKAK